ncbi:hypothetical protein [Rhodococcus sp. IEGM 1406]|uniref:hypothetical protein n=1 Tax=Rhodococcus TaxID=1827 RepID=UPI0024B6B88C|nr:hypothetical protein [Rhodococcus sp. IEGM 1406]MDI9905850.1 hypothetical protein [Rhodococcus sp. IEGM 1406]
MAHYIAELIAEIETVEPADRPHLQQRCAHEIERLWAHHTRYPSRRPPMASFEPLYRTLDRLSPDKPAWDFYNHFDDADRPDREETMSNNLLRAASELESTARNVVRTVIVEAASIAEQQESKWIEAASHLKDEEHDFLSVIRRMRRNTPAEPTEDTIDEDDSPTDSAIQALDEMINVCTKAKAALRERK